jgi:hypothetical protein
MRRFLASLSLALLALLVVAMPVLAGKNWCMRDPQVKLNGTQLQIWVAIPEEYVKYVNGPIKTTISTPSRVTREIVFTDTGFNGYGEEIRWSDLKHCTLLLLCSPAKVAADGSFDVQVSVTVPVDKNLLFNLLGARNIPLQLTVVYEDGTTKIVEMTNDGAKIDLRITGKST